MQPVANTPEIVYYKATNKSADDAWVQWAIDMLEAGFDTEHLRILAGETKPFNYWYLQPLTDKVFKELGIDTTDVAGITRRYICFLISEALTGNKSYDAVLYELHHFSYEEELLGDFYILYYAKQDLKYDEKQWYVHDATRENIDDLIRTRFEDWHYTHCGGTHPHVPGGTAEEITALVQGCMPVLFNLAGSLTTNTLYPNCAYIITEIKDSEDNAHIKRRKLTAENDKKIPMPLPQLVTVMQLLYPLMYDINFYIYKSTESLTVVDVRYYSKLSLPAEHKLAARYNPPMVHCKVETPFWPHNNKKKFDINWQHQPLPVWWRLLLIKLRLFR